MKGNKMVGKICLVVAGVELIAFCLAYPKVKRGEMVAYASWADFAIAGFVFAKLIKPMIGTRTIR